MKQQELEKSKEYKYGFVTDIESIKAPKGLNEKVKTVGCKKESKKGCTGKSIKCITHSLWDELENHINNFFENNTLRDIVFKTQKDKFKELN